MINGLDCISFSHNILLVRKTKSSTQGHTVGRLKFDGPDPVFCFGVSDGENYVVSEGEAHGGTRLGWEMRGSFRCAARWEPVQKPCRQNRGLWPFRAMWPFCWLAGYQNFARHWGTNFLGKFLCLKWPSGDNTIKNSTFRKRYIYIRCY